MIPLTPIQRFDDSVIDRRPSVERDKKQIQKVTLFKNLKCEDRCFIATTVATKGCFLAGAVVFFSSHGCGCCAVSAPAQQIMAYTGLGTSCGSIVTLLLEWGFFKYCGENEIVKKEETAQQDSEAQNAPQSIAMDECVISYQNAPLIGLASVNK